MAQWGSSDATSNAVLWAPAKYNQAPNTANRDALYGNTTANTFGTHKTVGMYAVDSTEIAVGAKYLSAASINGVGTGGSYVPGEILSVENTGATYTEAATVKVLTTKVRTVVANAGTGGLYTNNDTVTCNTGVMTTNAVFTVTTDGDGKISSLALTTNGVFTTNPTLADSYLKNLTVANNQANGGKATFTMRIDSIGVANPGTYSVAPTDLTNNDVTGSATGTGANVALTFSTKTKGITHTGWIVREVGSGGRAGRVQTEVLVAGGISTDNNNDDATFPDS